MNFEMVYMILPAVLALVVILFMFILDRRYPVIGSWSGLVVTMAGIIWMTWLLISGIRSDAFSILLLIFFVYGFARSLKELRNHRLPEER